jgi:hypothetical protein
MLMPLADAKDGVPTGKIRLMLYEQHLSEDRQEICGDISDIYCLDKPDYFIMFDINPLSK